MEEQTRRTNDLARLIDRALRQPGVAEFMEVYANWTNFESVAEAHRRIASVRRKVTVSNTSEAAAKVTL